MKRSEVFYIVAGRLIGVVLGIIASIIIMCR